jgi:hypothetical protein
MQVSGIAASFSSYTKRIAPTAGQPPVVTRAVGTVIH